MKIRVAIAACVAVAMAQGPAMAQQATLPAILFDALEISRVTHQPSKYDADLQRCGVAYEAVVAEAQAALRSHGLVVETHPNRTQTLGRYVAFRVSVRPIVPDVGSCHLLIGVKMGRMAYVKFSLTDVDHGVGWVEFCDQQYFVSGARGTLASPTGDAVRRAVARCVEEAPHKYQMAIGASD